MKKYYNVYLKKKNKKKKLWNTRTILIFWFSEQNVIRTSKTTKKPQNTEYKKNKLETHII